MRYVKQKQSKPLYYYYLLLGHGFIMDCILKGLNCQGLISHQFN